MSYELEKIVLKSFYDDISAAGALDNTISDSKIIRTTQAKLKAALKDVDRKCTCAKRTWGGPCEVCQVSGRELYALRNFFRVIKNAKRDEMSPAEIQSFIDNIRADLS